MKSKFFLLLLALVFSATFYVKAQISIPKGKALLIEFNNDSSRFMVPQGKTWYVLNVFTAPGKMDTYIYLKSLNDKTLSTSKFTESQLLLFGKSERPAFNFPLVLPSATTFELIILNGLYSKYDSEKSAYINVIEVNEE